MLVLVPAVLVLLHALGSKVFRGLLVHDAAANAAFHANFVNGTCHHMPGIAAEDAANATVQTDVVFIAATGGAHDTTPVRWLLPPRLTREAVPCHVQRDLAGARQPYAFPRHYLDVHEPPAPLLAPARQIAARAALRSLRLTTIIVAGMHVIAWLLLRLHDAMLAKAPARPRPADPAPPPPPLADSPPPALDDDDDTPEGLKKSV